MSRGAPPQSVSFTPGKRVSRLEIIQYVVFLLVLRQALGLPESALSR